jgi:hypothetical protein
MGWESLLSSHWRENPAFYGRITRNHSKVGSHANPYRRHSRQFIHDDSTDNSRGRQPPFKVGVLPVHLHEIGIECNLAYYWRFDAQSNEPDKTEVR